MIALRNTTAKLPRFRILPAAAALGFVLLVLPVAAFAIAQGTGWLRLPYQLFLVLQRLPLLFPLHMIASGSALVLIPLAILTRRHVRLHRWAGHLAAGCVALGGLSALPVALASVASTAARAGFFVQGVVWLGLLVTAVAAIRRGSPAWHARLMLAMAAVASGGIWLRLALALVSLTTTPFDPAYAVLAWACWLVPLAMCLACWPGLLPRAANQREQRTCSIQC